MKRFVRSNVELITRLLVVWHVVLTLAAAGGAILVAQNTFDPRNTWLKPLGVGFLLLEAVVAGAAVPFLVRRQPAGRSLSVAANYVGGLLAFLASLQALNVFVGIDTIAETFGQGVLFLIGVFVGYLIYTLGDRYSEDYRREQIFQRAGFIVMAIFFLIFLIRVDFFPWLLTVLSGLNAPLPIGLTVGAVLMLLVTWVLLQSPMAMAYHSTNSQDEAIEGYLFLSANLLGFLLFFAGPLLLSLYVSFTDWDAFGTKNWVGLQNYATIFSLDVAPLAAADQPVTEALDTAVYDELTRFAIFGRHYIVGAKDKLFWLALRNTLLFCLMAVPLSVIPALFLANVLNSKIPGMKAFRVIYFLPSIAAVVGVALIWQWLYNATIGYINYAITAGINLINALPGLALVDPQVRWLSDSDTALLAIVIMSAWQTMGFNSVLFLAGLQSIPGELYEAATVDGAGRWAKFWKITLPMLAPTTFFVLTTTTIQALQVFEQVYIATNPPGGPNNATLTVVLYLYQNGFQRFKQGYASATAWVLFAVIFLITLIQYRRQRAAEAAYA